MQEFRAAFGTKIPVSDAIEKDILKSIRWKKPDHVEEYIFPTVEQLVNVKHGDLWVLHLH